MRRDFPVVDIRLVLGLAKGLGRAAHEDGALVGFALHAAHGKSRRHVHEEARFVVKPGGVQPVIVRVSPFGQLARTCHVFGIRIACELGESVRKFHRPDNRVLTKLT